MSFKGLADRSGTDPYTTSFRMTALLIVAGYIGSVGDRSLQNIFLNDSTVTLLGAIYA